MKELISSIQHNLSKIEDGNITITEMEQLVSDSRELNERLIVLRYKVYEQGVLEIDIPANDEQLMEEPVAEIELEMFLEESGTPEIPILQMEETNEEINALDLPFELDLFAEKEENDQEEISSEEPEIETVIENNTFVSTSFDEETGIEEQVIKHEETSVIEEEQATIIVEKEEITTITTFKEPEIETPTNFVSEPVMPSFESPVSNSVNDSETASRVKSIEQSLRSNYSIMPLDTLIGSFTLNERLQFINELFEGSSDAFSTAVKKLDSQANLNSARTIVAEYADTNNWDLESEIVEDFLVKICRRYAADLSA